MQCSLMPGEDCVGEDMTHSKSDRPQDCCGLCGKVRTGNTAIPALPTPHAPTRVQTRVFPILMCILVRDLGCIYLSVVDTSLHSYQIELCVAQVICADFCAELHSRSPCADS